MHCCVRYCCTLESKKIGSDGKGLKWVKEISLTPDSPVYGRDDEGDRGEAYSCCHPLSDRQGPLGASTHQVEWCSTHAVNGEARDDHRGERLPHERVHHCNSYPPTLPRIVPVSLEEEVEIKRRQTISFQSSFTFGIDFLDTWKRILPQRLSSLCQKRRQWHTQWPRHNCPTPNSLAPGHEKPPRPRWHSLWT